MIEICPNFYVGHQGDYEYQVKGRDDWLLSMPARSHTIEIFWATQLAVLR